MTITSIRHSYMSRLLEQAWRIIRYFWAQYIGQCHDHHTDADGSQSGLSLLHNDYGSKFSLLCVWVYFKFELCFAVHSSVYEYESTMFSVLRLHLVLFGSMFSVSRLLLHEGMSQVLHFGFPIINW